MLISVNQLIVTACGDGKTAAAYLPLLVLKKLAAEPDLPWYGTRVPEQPVVLMVTPLSDLGHSQVSDRALVSIFLDGSPKPKVEEVKRLGIAAVALDVDNVKTASEQGRYLLKEVHECKWQLVIVSPERLTSPEFDKILQSRKFRKNLVLYVVDKAHIVIPWSLTFRKDYGQLGKVRARIQTNIPTLALTATSIVEIEARVMNLLGIRHYKMLRRSCERVLRTARSITSE